MNRSERFRQPEEDYSKQERVEKSFSFPYQHPETGCENDNQIISRKFKAKSKKIANLLAENEKVICGGCGIDYKLLSTSKHR